MKTIKATMHHGAANAIGRSGVKTPFAETSGTPPILRVGQVISYQDTANPRREFLVIDDVSCAPYFQQRCLCEDGDESQVSARHVADGGTGCAGWRFVLGDDGEPKVLVGGERDAFVKAALQAKEDREQDAATRVAS